MRLRTKSHRAFGTSQRPKGLAPWALSHRRIKSHWHLWYLPGGSHKTPVVVVLADTTVALNPSYWQGRASLTHYIDPLFSRLGESNDPLVGYVTYDSLHSNGPPIEVTGFLPLGTQPKLKGIPSGQTKAGDPLGMLALDGYVEALKLIDLFKSGCLQNSEEKFSYHLLHIAAGQYDHNETTRCDFSPTLWNVRWETLPNEIKMRDINLSMILLNSCPKFSDVFYAISPTPIEPWFQKCPLHTILLAGFASSPERGGKTSPTIPAKRPAEDPTEEGCSQRRTRRSLSEPTPAPALALAKAQDQGADQWSGTLIWPRENSPDVCLQALTVNRVRHFNTAALQKILRVEFLESGTQTRDIQAYIRKKQAPMARITHARETDTPELETNTHESETNRNESETNASAFKALMDSLRERKCFAIARCQAQGKDSHLSSLLLAPLGENLLCAILPTSNPEDLPKARPDPPAEKKQLQADYPPPAENSPMKLVSTECLQGDPLCPPPATPTMPTPDFRQMLPQRHQIHHPATPTMPTQDFQQVPPQQHQFPHSAAPTMPTLGFRQISPQQYQFPHPAAFPTATPEFQQIPQYQTQQQQHPSPPCHFQGPLSQPQAQEQAQHCQQYASSDTPPALPDGFNRLIGPLTENEACLGYDQTYADTYAMDGSPDLYVGGVDEVGPSVVIPGQTNGLEAQQFVFQQYPGLPEPVYSNYNQ